MARKKRLAARGSRLGLAGSQNSLPQTILTSHNAPINVKPEGGGGVRATHGNLTVACIPRVGILIGHYAFYLSIL